MQVTRREFLKASAVTAGVAITGMGFALHPVNTESVSFIASRNNMMSGFFSLCAIYFYIKGQRKGRVLLWVLSLLSFLCALFSKEFGVMVLPVLFLYRRIWGDRDASFKGELTSYLPYVLLLAVYFVLRKTATQSLVTPFDPGDVWVRIFFIPYIILFDLRLNCQLVRNWK